MTPAPALCLLVGEKTQKPLHFPFKSFYPPITLSFGKLRDTHGNHLTIAYQTLWKKLALDDFTATLTPGIYDLLGANGAGKTTLISILTGIISSNTGNIYADGVDTRKLGNPSTLILDEPTAGLDPQERIRFRNLISKFSKNRIVLLGNPHCIRRGIHRK